MDTDHTGVLIIGAGQAGATAAAALRDFGYQDRILVVGSEQPLPYERPPLSKTMLSGSGAVADILVHPTGFHKEKSIETLLEAEVASLDVQGHTALLKSGKTITWQQCLIATGGKARTIAGLTPGTAHIHYLRTIADALRLREEMRQCRSVLIVGGGFLGLEVASTARSMGLSATVLEGADRVLGRAVPPDMSAWLRQSITDAGVDLQLNARCESFDVRADGVSIGLAGGETLSADMMVVAIGLEPEVAMASRAGLSIHSGNGGICVDAQCMTSAPDVYAAGDCSSQTHPFIGSEIRLESWQNANEQARLAAAAIAGVPTAPLNAPWFWSDQFGNNLQILGMPVAGLRYHRRGEFSNPDTAPKFMLLGTNEADQILHAIALNAGGDLRQLKPLIDSKTPCDPISLCDATAPLRPLVRAALARTPTLTVS
ncbi:3-phenylpropionate/trans-cinnamate dioxygenase ferredoxin reductase subunit [Polaromonas sp. OV174]|uniref:NAD(P)/FAD-dependent oxidoreductase n=1 Tax=Polaromonas sp. OV174 TaxID=1855300 RepID=UPI0008E1332E|nr:FAD-dependent oxidoreductase [Polaromonas sp. OV174]SFC63200.1 3-phenylpropionate/trans-cinnamate dioxygenase ferredoxin reductase subunit [Polaromonas sp. OV174]